MGNEDGMTSALSSLGQNKRLPFGDEGNQFSFAFGNEIALCLDGSYYILNCTSKLWDEVKTFMKTERSLEEIKVFWLEHSKTYEISDWSGSFDDLKGD